MCQSAYERGQTALYLAMLLPPDDTEARAVLALVGELLPVLAKNRAAFPTDDDSSSGEPES